MSDVDIQRVFCDDGHSTAKLIKMVIDLSRDTMDGIALWKGKGSFLLRPQMHFLAEHKIVLNEQLEEGGVGEFQHKITVNIP